MESNMKYFIFGILFLFFGSIFGMALLIHTFGEIIVIDSVEYHSPAFELIQKNMVYDHIVSVGGTFQYDSNYTIYLEDAYPESANIQLIQNDDFIAQTVCYENSLCQIRDVSFQIDDIHIGKEHSYIVYWAVSP